MRTHKKDLVLKKSENGTSEKRRKTVICKYVFYMET